MDKSGAMMQLDTGMTYHKVGRRALIWICWGEIDRYEHRWLWLRDEPLRFFFKNETDGWHVDTRKGHLIKIVS